MFDQFDVSLHALQVRSTAGGEVVQHPHPMSGAEEFFHQVRADKASSSRH
jgi:hypothetical protein